MLNRILHTVVTVTSLVSLLLLLSGTTTTAFTSRLDATFTRHPTTTTKSHPPSLATFHHLPRLTATHSFHLAAAGPATIEKEKVKSPTSEKTTQKDRVKDKGWAVRLYNDPFNKREFVARCLMTITGMSDGAAYQVMMQAHQNGIAVVGRYHLERAESYLSSLKSEGLFVDMVQDDD